MKIGRAYNFREYLGWGTVGGHPFSRLAFGHFISPSDKYSYTLSLN